MSVPSLPVCHVDEKLHAIESLTLILFREKNTYFQPDLPA